MTQYTHRKKSNLMNEALDWKFDVAKTCEIVGT